MKEPLNLRQKLAIHMALFIIDILSPYEYSHQWKEWKEGFVKMMNGQ